MGFSPHSPPSARVKLQNKSSPVAVVLWPPHEARTEIQKSDKRRNPRFVETNPFGGVCNPSVAPCIGGFARLTTAVRDAMTLEPDSLLLNAGDSFQGTIWYNLLRWNVTAEFMNLLPHDAHVSSDYAREAGRAQLDVHLQEKNQTTLKKYAGCHLSHSTAWKYFRDVRRRGAGAGEMRQNVRTVTGKRAILAA
ncbi:Apyrase [Eumeta japonica]|uniref:Apyrase n=1 Tax=Eumeta variegata TaxID=151549 RepID=A0A4C1TNA8_EUMVA|nr:Apyrase [Eumeta japonica]